jgi:prephenate dehydrogenase
VPTTAEEHDAAVARISHLPHLLAAVLASVGADGGPLALSLAAGSFGDGTRVAGSHPELVRAMCEGNRSALLAAVDDALGRLGAARGSLASTGGLAKTIEAGHTARVALENRPAHTDLTIDLTAPDARRTLRDLGARGGRITGLNGTTALARTP